MQEVTAILDEQTMADDGNTLDLRGLKCPLPVLKTRNHLRKLSDEESIWIHTDDPLAVIDIPNFCNEYSQILLDQKSDAEGSHLFHIQRSGDLR